jgi:hypothetical protein
MAARTTSSSRGLWASAAILIAVGAGLGVYWLQPRAAPPPAAATAPTTLPATRPVTIAVIMQEARELKLLTWGFETTVDAQSVSDKWYGDAIANVRAPVRYQYGVDLATLEERSVFRDAGTGALLFIVKPPQRLSVEVDVERLEQTLRTSGMRWRSNNQKQLRRTVNELGAIANNLQLSPGDEQRMREASRQQLERHLHRVLARLEPGVVVHVKFAE